eukprot:TRINITY_DN4547_c0_g1_i4.p1 TRINITY_DN4547_c0_g1~~TRINITY_DN4547_c0_g1_i4.p1  ORF type:complete len:475 (-),score=20.39 TRINITY_DN4547_c0_g1_i4:27-1451(-)
MTAARGLNLRQRAAILLAFCFLTIFIAFKTSSNRDYTEDVPIAYAPPVPTLPPEIQAVCKSPSTLPPPSPPRKLSFRPVPKNRPLKILRWRSPSWPELSQNIFDNPDVQKLGFCEYPIELTRFFTFLDQKFGPFRWPTRRAPCYLFNTNTTGTCAFPAGSSFSSLDYILTSDFREFSSADIILVDYPYLMMASASQPPFLYDELLPPHLPGQKWVLQFVGESLVYYPLFGLPFFLRKFDLSLGAHSKVFDMTDYPYVSLEWLDEKSKFWQAPKFTYEEKKRHHPLGIAWISSNCSPKNGRDRYAVELSKHVTIDSFGRCMPTREWPQDIRVKYQIPFVNKAESHFALDWKNIALETTQPYLFALAFENSDCYDYVTEKVYMAFEAGVIPIYMGASNIDEFIPDKNSIIRVSDFESALDLANHLKRVASNKELYQSYFKWKDNAKQIISSSKLAEKARLRQTSYTCRILERVSND